MTTNTQTTEVVMAAAVVRLDDETAARDAFANLIAKHGRPVASRIWADAVRIVEGEYPPEMPTRCAPDCIGYCAETYIDEDCEPCNVLEAARRPQLEPRTPFVCGCGYIAAPDDMAQLDHVETCKHWNQ